MEVGRGVRFLEADVEDQIGGANHLKVDVELATNPGAMTEAAAGIGDRTIKDGRQGRAAYDKLTYCCDHRTYNFTPASW